MSVEVRLTNRDFLVTGEEPEYLATRLVQYEQVGRDMLRFYVAAERGGILRVEHTSLVTHTDLAAMIQAGLYVANSLRQAGVMMPLLGKLTH